MKENYKMTGQRLPQDLHKIPLSQFSSSSQQWFKETLKNDILEFFTGPDRVLRIRDKSDDEQNTTILIIKYEEYQSYKTDDFINRLITYTNNGYYIDFIKLKNKI